MAGPGRPRKNPVVDKPLKVENPIDLLDETQFPNVTFDTYATGARTYRLLAIAYNPKTLETKIIGDVECENVVVGKSNEIGKNSFKSMFQRGLENDAKKGLDKK